MMMMIPEREQNNQNKKIENHSKINKVSNLQLNVTKCIPEKNYKNREK